jgi:uncharacterized Zn finger protein
MKLTCIACGREVNLDHEVFQNYEGPVKCFFCGTMMEVKTTQGIADHVAFLEGPRSHGDKSARIVESQANQQQGAP